MNVMSIRRLITFSEEIVDGKPIYVSSNCVPIKALKLEPAGHAFHTAALRLFDCVEEKDVKDDMEQKDVWKDKGTAHTFVSPDLLLDPVGPDDWRMDLSVNLRSIINKGIKRGTIKVNPITSPDDFKKMVSESDEWQRHLRQRRESEGYEADVFPKYASSAPVTLVGPVVGDFTKLAKDAIQSFNMTNNTCYEFVKLVRAIRSGILCFITFKVKAKDKQVEEDFQTKWRFTYKRIEMIHVRPKPLKKE